MIFSLSFSLPTIIIRLLISFTVNGYVRPHLYHTGLSEYQGTIARVAYELVRDDRIPRYKAANGGRPTWGYPPDGVRQPELDGIPFDGERLYD